MATNPTPLNIACLEILALNVLKNLSPEKIASEKDKEKTNLDKYEME
ncbi:607_t:CDS:1, partial [Gigaspora rosea]